MRCRECFPVVFGQLGAAVEDVDRAADARPPQGLDQLVGHGRGGAFRTHFGEQDAPRQRSITGSGRSGPRGAPQAAHTLEPPGDRGQRRHQVGVGFARIAEPVLFGRHRVHHVQPVRQGVRRSGLVKYPAQVVLLGRGHRDTAGHQAAGEELGRGVRPTDAEQLADRVDPIVVHPSGHGQQEVVQPVHRAGPLSHIHHARLLHGCPPLNRDGRQVLRLPRTPAPTRRARRGGTRWVRGLAGAPRRRVRVRRAPAGRAGSPR